MSLTQSEEIEEMSALSAGVARVIITPPIGIGMTGFAGRGPAEGVHDDLLATALALETDGAHAIVIAADVLYLTAAFCAEVRAEIARRTSVPPQNVLLCGSHTHYGPEVGTNEQEELPDDVAAYLRNLKFLLAGAAQAALAAAQPVRIGFGEGASFIGVNRRERRDDGQIVLGQNPGGPCDREVRVVRLDMEEGRPLAALVNFACHPVSAASAMRLLSADYVGPMRQIVERATGATCLFLQGAAGNINPVEMRHSFEPARRLGTMLGGAVVTAFEGAMSAPAEDLAARSAVLELPAMTFPSREAGEREVAGLREQVDRLKNQNSGSGSLFWAQRRLERAERMLDSLLTGMPLPPIEAEVMALRFGDVALVTAPGEIFTETGMAVKRRSPFPRTCYVGYANGTIGYVPVPAAYDEGGYEVTHACRVGPAAASRIEEASVALLHELRAAS